MWRNDKRININSSMGHSDGSSICSHERASESREQKLQKKTRRKASSAPEGEATLLLGRPWAGPASASGDMHSLWNSAVTPVFRTCCWRKVNTHFQMCKRAPSQTTSYVLPSPLCCCNWIKQEINNRMINRPLETHQHRRGDNWSKRQS